MNNKKLILFLIFAGIILFSSCNSCSTGRQACPDITGTWNIDRLDVYDEHGQQLDSIEEFGTLVLYPDNKGLYWDGEALEWSQGRRDGECMLYMALTDGERNWRIESDDADHMVLTSEEEDGLIVVFILSRLQNAAADFLAN